MARSGKNQYGPPHPKKRCNVCKEELAVSRFSHIKKHDPNLGRKDTCKTCAANKAEKERLRRNLNWKHKPALSMLNNSKQRAKRAGIEHTLTLDDMVIPDLCPVLGIKLETGDRKNHQNAPSIDRIDNTRGYVKDNILIMSVRANMIKKDATLREIILLGEWAKNLMENE